MTRIFIEDNELDIDKELANRITYAIDDLERLDSKSTAFSKTIVIPGTATNNYLLGNIFDFNNSNYTFNNQPNVKYNFNASKSAKCRIEVNGLQIVKGVFRLLEIVYNDGQVEYECSVFGELGGFISKVGNARLEDLDFSTYDHAWTYANIDTSWAYANSGFSYYYPLIDIGDVSTGKHGRPKRDYQYQAFRPALHVREYIDKIITNAGYTWESDFFNTDFFKRLIIPCNKKELTKVSSTAFDAIPDFDTYSTTANPQPLSFPTVYTSGNFTGGPETFTYNSANPLTGTLNLELVGTFTKVSAPGSITIYVYKNLYTSPTVLGSFSFGAGGTSGAFEVILNLANISFLNGDTLTIAVNGPPAAFTPTYSISINDGFLNIITDTSQGIPINYGEIIPINDTIPRGIYQKDFFASILKMFYLLVSEDKFKERHLVITPWIDFFNTDISTFIDWSDKVDRMKEIRVKPMSEVNARFYELKYKEDADFYNEAYKKKYNEVYGTMMYDNGLEFSKEKESVDVIFANSVLTGYLGEDKIVPAIFKKSGETEERIDHVIRIMQAKLITGVASWDIKDAGTNLAVYTQYPYAGHLDDPDAPNADICFGVPKELQFSLASGNLSNNLFNAFYSSYMAEITDKDSRLLQVMVKLTETDIYNLDFSKFIYIDGGIYRLQKLIDYAAGENETTKAELLRVIYTTY